jgi:hypothetical protein
MKLRLCALNYIHSREEREREKTKREREKERKMKGSSQKLEVSN